MHAAESFRQVASAEDLLEDQLNNYRSLAEEIDKIDGIKSERLNEALRIFLESSITKKLD